MAKKEKVGPASAGEDTTHRPVTTTAPQSHSTQTAQSEVKTSIQTAAVSPAQMENSMVQQILERQAVFGF